MGTEFELIQVFDVLFMQSRTIDLWVPLDSYKQAKDMENKLMGLEGMPKHFLADTLLKFAFVIEKSLITYPLISYLQRLLGKKIAAYQLFSHSIVLACLEKRKKKMALVGMKGHVSVVYKMSSYYISFTYKNCHRFSIFADLMEVTMQKSRKSLEINHGVLFFQ